MAEKEKQVVVGVDTHKRFHVVTVISELGERLAFEHFEANAKGYDKALKWAKKHGSVLRAGIEATGSYGAGLTERFRKDDIEVFDVYRPDKQERRRRGKNDVEDSFQAAEAALAYIRCAVAKEKSGLLEAARMLEGAYELVVRQRTATMNLLRADITTLPAKMRERLEGLCRSELLKTCANFRISKGAGAEEGMKAAVRHLARKVQAMDKEAADLEKQIEQCAKKLAPRTLSLPGIGCHGTIRLLCSAGQNIDRLKSDAAFSMLCGTSPIPASSGNNIHLRLNKGGDRKANSVLYIMAINRIQRCEKTQAFIAKKMSENKSKKDAIRALKRYLAREVYYALKADIAKLGMTA